MSRPNQLRNLVRFLDFLSFIIFEALMVCEEEISVEGSTPQETASHADSDISLASTTQKSNHMVQSATSRGVINANSLVQSFRRNPVIPLHQYTRHGRSEIHESSAHQAEIESPTRPMPTHVGQDEIQADEESRNSGGRMALAAIEVSLT